MANRTKFTTEKREIFLDALSQGSSVTFAARLVGISRRAAYNARDKSKKFREEWDFAVEEGTDLLEDEAKRRAYEGVDHPVTYQGVITTTYKEYSDTLLMFLLKGRRPEKYRERHEVTGEGGGPVPISITDWKKRAQQQLDQVAGLEDDEGEIEAA